MMSFFRIPTIAELEKALGLPANSVAIASRQSKGGEGETYAIAFFDHEVGKDFPDFALKNCPIGAIKAAVKDAIASTESFPEEARQGTDPRSIFRNALTVALFKTTSADERS